MTHSLRTKFMFLFWILAMVFIVAEVSLRIRWRLKSGTWDVREYIDWQYSTYTRHPYLRFTIKPEARFRAGAGSHMTNAQGFRGPEAIIPKPEGTYRILCLGGSTTFSVGVKDYQDAWPAKLQAQLAKAHPDKTIEVVNAGVPGYHSLDSIINYHLRLTPLQPDLVIVYHGINDIQTVATPDYQPDYSHQKKLLFADEKSEGWERILQSSLVIVKLRKTLRRKKTSAYERDVKKAVQDEASKESAKVLTRNLRHLVTLIRDSGADVMMATFALSYNLELPEEDIKTYAGNWAFYAPSLSRTGLARTMDLINKDIQELGVELKIPVAAVASALPPGRENFTDLVHFTKTGATLMAATMAATIEANSLLNQ